MISQKRHSLIFYSTMQNSQQNVLLMFCLSLNYNLSQLLAYLCLYIGYLSFLFSILIPQYNANGRYENFAEALQTANQSADNVQMQTD